MVRRTSNVWKISKETLIAFVKESTSFSDLLLKIGLINKGGNYKTVRQRLIEDKIDFSNIIHRHIVVPIPNKIPNEELFIENCKHHRHIVKKAILRERLIINKCAICGQAPIWNNKPLSLVLDHVNGEPNDNRLENLRFLCPNCNSQTETFTGKKNRIEHMCVCGNKYYGNRRRCESCRKRNGQSYPRYWLRKVVRPSKNILIEEVERLGFVGTGKKYGVSDNAVRKWIKFYEKQEAKDAVAKW